MKNDYAFRVGYNIRYLRQLKQISQEQLADALGITRSRLGAYEEARNEPPLEILVKLSEYFHVAIDAIVKGDLRKTDLNGLMKIGKNRILFPILIDKEGNDLIELVPMRASAGYLKGYADPDYVEKLPKMQLPFLPTGKFRAFPIRGDSMPPLHDGSFVIGKFLEKPDDIKPKNTYILVTKDDGITYKRVMQINKRKQLLELHSDNKKYPPFSVKFSDVLEVWEFVCSINIGQYEPEELNMQSILNMLKGLKVEIESIKK